MAEGHDVMECLTDEDEQFSWLDGVYEVWEENRVLRQRARSGRSIMVGVRRKSDLQEVCLGTLKCASLKAFMCQGIVSRMAESGILKNPPLGRLYSELVKFQQQNGSEVGHSLLALAHVDAWGLKRVLTILRRKWARGEQPRDS